MRFVVEPAFEFRQSVRAAQGPVAPLQCGHTGDPALPRRFPALAARHPTGLARGHRQDAASAGRVDFGAVASRVSPPVLPAARFADGLVHASAFGREGRVAGPELRHSHAFHAILGGESLHVTGGLLSHRCLGTTNPYAHMNDATLNQAAERVALAIQRKIGHFANVLSYPED